MVIGKGLCVLQLDVNVVHGNAKTQCYTQNALNIIHVQLRRFATEKSIRVDPGNRPTSY